MGVNISGKGILSGLASFVVDIISNFPLLASKVLGYTSSGGGSSYYTTTVTTTTGSSSNKFVGLFTNNMFQKVLAISDDGYTWETLTADLPNNPWSNIVYGGEKFLTYDSTLNKMAVSSNGVNWTIYDSPIGLYNNPKLEYVKDRFILTDFMSSKESFDGTNWTTPTLSNPFYAYDSSSDLLVGGNSQGAHYYNNATSSWVQSTSPVFDNLVNDGHSKWINDIIWGGGVFVAITGTGHILRSTDGVNWGTSSVHQIFDQVGGKFLYGRGKFVLITNNGSAYWSTDGTYWANSNRVSPSTLLSPSYSIFTGGTYGTFYAVPDGSQNSNLYYYSDDGTSWHEGTFDGYNANATGGATGLTYGTISTLTTITEEIQVSIGDQGSGGAEILAPTDIYTVPENTVTTIDQVRIKNTSPNSITYDLGVLDSGVALSDINALINDQSVAGGSTAVVSNISTPMTYGQRIVVLPSAVDVVEVKVYGDEVYSAPHTFIGLMYTMAFQNGESALMYLDGSQPQPTAGTNIVVSGNNNSVFNQTYRVGSVVPTDANDYYGNLHGGVFTVNLEPLDNIFIGANYPTLNTGGLWV